jgi:hypothetical protein
LRGKARRIGFHPPSAVRIETLQRQINQTLVLRRISFHDRPIGLVDSALLEQKPELLDRLVVPPEHEAAGGVAVEPGDERGIAWQAKAQRMEIIFEIFAALRAAMDRNPCASR